MDPASEKQAWIDGQRKVVCALYPSIWDKLISGVNSSGLEDQVWMMYSANYIFRTGGVRWAIDPLTLKCRLPQAPEMDAARGLQHMDFVLLTHRHKDHLDSDLLRQLNQLPIRWVVPQDMLLQVKRQSGLSADQVIVPEPGHPIDFHGLRITPFDGLHYEKVPDFPNGRRGVPATGYLVEMGDRSWLFPGDTRAYDPAGLPEFRRVDVLFAHVWLGRAAALKPDPPLLEEFCRFCLAFQPRRIILTHLQEWGRQAADLWDLEHASKVVTILEKLAPSLPVEVAITGDEITLE